MDRNTKALTILTDDTMPRSTREGWNNWKKSAAREVLLDDLQQGLLPADAAELSAEEAWEICYQHMAEFVPVVFDQFKERLRDHRKQVWADLIQAASESDSLAHDRHLFP